MAARRTVESILVGAAGAVVAWLVYSRWDLFGINSGYLAAAVAGVNGVIGGAAGTYDWRRPRGWLAFVLDSTWALLGTFLGLLVHGANLFTTKPVYVTEMYCRKNVHVYENGFGLRPDYALAMGNVISNAGGRVGLRGESESVARRQRFVISHESVHVLQSRTFGPLYQAIYLGWMAVAGVVAVILWAVRERKDLGQIVETLAYYNNPFETWAYRSDGYWPPKGAIRRYAWGRAREPDKP